MRDKTRKQKQDFPLMVLKPTQQSLEILFWVPHQLNTAVFSHTAATAADEYSPHRALDDVKHSRLNVPLL